MFVRSYVTPKSKSSKHSAFYYKIIIHLYTGAFVFLFCIAEALSAIGIYRQLIFYPVS